MPDQLIERLKELEKLSDPLEPSAQQREMWLTAIRNYTEHFFQTLPSRPTYQTGNTLDTDITDLSKTANIDQLLSTFHKEIVNNGIDTASSRYMGFIPGGGIYSSAIGDYIAALANTYAASVITSPGAVAMEKALIQWLATMFGLPANSTGNLTSGGSIANMIALVTARDAHNIHAHNIPSTVIYLSTITHHCVTKCLKLIGLADAIIRVIPTNQTFQIDTKILKHAIASDVENGLTPWLIIGNAGTTDTGSIDPLEELSNIAEQHQMWFHVDAAYGGFFILTKHGRALLKGIERADSLVVDPHKGLFIAYGLGAVIIKHPDLHLHSFESDAPYMQDVRTTEENWSPYDVSPELTKHFRAVRLWLSIKLIGIKPFTACLDEKLLLAQYFYKELRTIPEIEILCQPELSIVVFRLAPTNTNADAITKKLHDMLCEQGEVFLSSTNIDGRYYIRMACLSFRTHLKEIQLCLSLIKDATHQCLKQQLHKTE